VIHLRENDWVLNFAKVQGCLKFVDAMESAKASNTDTPWTFKIYELDVVPKDWRCKHSEIVSDLIIPSASLYGNYNTRHDMINKHINITLKNGEYYVHPGTLRYFMNCVVDDFSVSALIIDHDHNYNKIIQDFPKAKIVDHEIDYTLHQSGNSFTLKLNSGWPTDTTIHDFAFEAINFFELAVPNAQHSVKIFLDKQQLVSYDNEKPEMNVHVDDIYGWARFIIDYYCERKLTYNGYQTDI